MTLMSGISFNYILGASWGRNGFGIDCVISWGLGAAWYDYVISWGIGGAAWS